MAQLEACVRSVQMDGLTWGGSKLVPVGYGIRKLQIQCVVEDDKVGTDLLEEEITKFEEHVSGQACAGGQVQGPAGRPLGNWASRDHRPPFSRCRVWTLRLSTRSEPQPQPHPVGPAPIKDCNSLSGSCLVWALWAGAFCEQRCQAQPQWCPTWGPVCPTAVVPGAMTITPCLASARPSCGCDLTLLPSPVSGPVFTHPASAMSRSSCGPGRRQTLHSSLGPRRHPALHSPSASSLFPLSCLCGSKSAACSCPGKRP